MPVPPLPLERFPAFLEFAKKKAPKEGWPCEEWPCGGRQSWSLKEAAGFAVAVAHALGAFSVEAESPEAAELRALAWWLSIFDTPEWLAASRRAMLLAGNLDQQPAGFALDNNTFGFDHGAWALMDGNVVRRLNTWSRHALTAFYAANSPATQPEMPPAPAGITESRWRAVWQLYVAHVTTSGRRPTIAEDNDWRKLPEIAVTQIETRALRREWAKL
jgi:hypothetical protein